MPRVLLSPRSDGNAESHTPLEAESQASHFRNQCRPIHLQVSAEGRSKQALPPTGEPCPRRLTLSDLFFHSNERVHRNSWRVLFFEGMVDRYEPCEVRTPGPPGATLHHFLRFSPIAWH